MSHRLDSHGGEPSDLHLSAEQRAEHEAQLLHAAELVDRYGATLFQLAWVISADCAVASSAVVRVIVAASLDHARLEQSRSLRAELSRLTLWACTVPVTAGDPSPVAPIDEEGAGMSGVLRSIPPRDRALVALTMFGDHTYREAAALIGVAPETATEALTSAGHTLSAAESWIRT